MFNFLPFSLTDFSNFINGNNYTGTYKYIFGLLLLSILTIWSFLTFTGYFLILYLIKYTNIEYKYPKLKKIIEYIQNLKVTFVIIESIFTVSLHIIICGIYIYLLNIN